MNAELRNKILTDWGIFALPLDQQIIKIFKKVRDIPFGSIDSRNPADIYEKNKGTCSGKSFLARGLYKDIGLKTKDMICLQRWKDLIWYPDDRYGLVALPGELRQMLEQKEVIDFHNYVRIFIDSTWVTVDVTIDLPLRKLGFYTTENWDGKSDMPLCFVGSHKVWDCGDNGMEKKAELTDRLPEHIRDARHQFLISLTGWLDGLRERREV